MKPDAQYMHVYIINGIAFSKQFRGFKTYNDIPYTHFRLNRLWVYNPAARAVQDIMFRPFSSSAVLLFIGILGVHILHDLRTYNDTTTALYLLYGSQSYTRALG